MRVSLARSTPEGGRLPHLPPRPARRPVRRAPGAERGLRARATALESFRQVRFDHAKDSRFPLDREARAGGLRHVPPARRRRGGPLPAARHSPAPVPRRRARGPARREGKGDRLRPLPRDGRLEGACAGPLPAPSRSPRSRSTASTANVACERCHPRGAGRNGAEVRRYRPLADRRARAATPTSTRARSGGSADEDVRHANGPLAAAVALSAGAAPARGQGVPGALRPIPPAPISPRAAPSRPRGRDPLRAVPHGRGLGEGHVLARRHGLPARGSPPRGGLPRLPPGRDLRRRRCRAPVRRLPRATCTRAGSVARCENCHDADRLVHHDLRRRCPPADRLPAHRPPRIHARASRATAIAATAGSRGRRASASAATRRTCCALGRAALGRSRRTPGSRATAGSATAPGASRPPALPAHEACFAIARGHHAGIRCRDCHTSLPPVDYRQPFTCQTDTAACVALPLLRRARAGGRVRLRQPALLRVPPLLDRRRRGPRRAPRRRAAMSRASVLASGVALASGRAGGGRLMRASLALLLLVAVEVPATSSAAAAAIGCCRRRSAGAKSRHGRSRGRSSRTQRSRCRGRAKSRDATPAAPRHWRGGLRHGGARLYRRRRRGRARAGRSDRGASRRRRSGALHGGRRRGSPRRMPIRGAPSRRHAHVRGVPRARCSGAAAYAPHRGGARRPRPGRGGGARRARRVPAPTRAARAALGRGGGSSSPASST